MKPRAINPRMLKGLLVKRPRDCHKGNFGRVLIAAGSRGMSGAAVLAARAALKSGAGLVTVAIPASLSQVITAAVPEALTLPLPESPAGSVGQGAVGEVLSWNASQRGRCDILLVGPGLSTGKGVFEFVRGLLNGLLVPSVVDADALNTIAFSRKLKGVFPSNIPCILTPHPGEMSRLLTASLSRVDGAMRLSSVTRQVVVLKGSGTVITDASSVFKNPTGGPALAKGGTGDILAGLIAGLWAQHGKICGFSLKSAMDSSLLGVYLHGLCGDMASKELTQRCVLAGELLNYLPGAFRKIRSGI